MRFCLRNAHFSVFQIFWKPCSVKTAGFWNSDIPDVWVCLSMTVSSMKTAPLSTTEQTSEFPIGYPPMNWTVCLCRHCLFAPILNILNHLEVPDTKYDTRIMIFQSSRSIFSSVELLANQFWQEPVTCSKLDTFHNSDCIRDGKIIKQIGKLFKNKRIRFETLNKRWTIQNETIRFETVNKCSDPLPLRHWTASARRDWCLSPPQQGEQIQIPNH